MIRVSARSSEALATSRRPQEERSPAFVTRAPLVGRKVLSAAHRWGEITAAVVADPEAGGEEQESEEPILIVQYFESEQIESCTLSEVRCCCCLCVAVTHCRRR